MSSEILSFKLRNSQNHCSIKVDIVDYCPHCFKGIKPHIIYTTEYDDKLKSAVAILFQCPSCQKYFVNAYETYGLFDNSISAYHSNLIPYTYKPLVEYDLPEELESISKAFKEIYIQTLKAEAEDLSQIAGIGYRKSIEFLIKDFLISYQKEDTDKISKMPLSQAIDKIESQKIRDLAKASVWLGNDETHYLKKYEDRDINDMKRFIRALAYFISSELTASEAQKFIGH
ncbi:DUF4145 domain-containing protein [Thermoanaerobacterium thermosaccharolyticum]|uniref:DUF4145 domain-containing protein n=1 Tax=Thermoanaerobacterium thermosaccharolyticum TaxID=1517 RepID=UPI003DA7B67F